MDIYLIQNGERRGPFHVFQIKEMVDRGEAALTDLGWHDGLDGWRPIQEIDTLSPYLPGTVRPPPLPDPATVTAQPDPDPDLALDPARAPLPPGRIFPWRRFGARLVDVWLLKSSQAGICLALGVITPGEYLFPWPWLVLGFFVLGSVVEAFMLARWGCTPGKWIFRLRVIRPDGGPPRFGEAVTRAFHGWFLGWALGTIPFILVTGIAWWVMYRRTGRSWWDLRSGLDVVSEPLRWPRLVVVPVYLVAQFAFNTWLFWHHPAPGYLPPPLGGHSLREIFDEPARRMQQEWNRQNPPPPRPR